MFEKAIVEENDSEKTSKRHGTDSTELNFDTQSYEFEDLDLKMAVSMLPHRDRDIIILHLMGHKQHDIGRLHDVSRSMISKRLRIIMDRLARRLA